MPTGNDDALQVPAASNEPARWERWIGHAGRASLLYLALTLVMTFPLVLRLGASVPAGSVDLWQNYWNFWWWKECLLSPGRNPYHTPYLFFPAGTDMTFYTHSVFNMVVAFPATLIGGPGAGYNLCVLLALWTSGVGAYLLARDVTGDAAGAFLAGLIYAFFPHHQEQTIEHLNLFSIQFIPLAILYFNRLVRDGGCKNIAGLATFYALNALCDWHLAIKLTLALLVFLSIALLRRPRPLARMILDFVFAGAIACAAIFPAAWPLIRGMAGGETFFQKAAQDRGIDALYLFIPMYHHPLLGGLVSGAYAHRAYDAAGFVCYLGYTPLALAALALARKTRGARFWLGFLLVSLLLALGTHPWVGGRLIESVTLPFALIGKLPALKLMRIANRFMIPASLGLAMLAALGWTALRSKGWRPLLALASLILLEYLWLPYPTQPDRLSPYYAKLAADPKPGAVLDIPFTPDGWTVQNMRAQTIHGRPIAGGYLSTVPPEPLKALRSDEQLSSLMGLEPKFDRPLDVKHLARLGFGWIIVHKDRRKSYADAEKARLADANLFDLKAISRLGGVEDAFMDKIQAQLNQACGPPTYEDGMIVVFPLPETGK